MKSVEEMTALVAAGAAKERKRRKALWRSIAGGTAAVCAAAFAIILLKAPDMPPDPSRAAEQEESTADPRRILWAGTALPQRIGMLPEAWTFIGSDTPVSFQPDPQLEKAIEEAGEEQPIAFAVIPGGNYAFDSGRLSRDCREARSRLDAQRRQLAEEYQNKQGLTAEEADRRAREAAAYHAAAEELDKRIEAYGRAKLEALYAAWGKLLGPFEEAGFTVLYTAEDEAVKPYLSQVGAVGICLGTAEQLRALETESFGSPMRLRAVPENVTSYRFGADSGRTDPEAETGTG